jgi:hypothetical protein
MERHGTAYAGSSYLLCTEARFQDVMIRLPHKKLTPAS